MEIIKNVKQPNQIKVALALAKASFLSTLRNPTSLFFSFFFPFIFISVFGLLGQGKQTFDIGVREASLQKGPFYEALQNIEVVKLVTNLSNDNLDEKLKKGEIPVVITISENGTAVPKNITGEPTDNSKDPAPNRQLSKQSILIEKSAAAPEEAQTVSSILTSIAQSINSQSTPESLKLIDLNETTVEGRKFTRIDFILPGQLSFSLLSNAMFGIAITFVTMRKQLIIKRIFAAPINRSVLIIGEALSKSLIAILQSLLIISVGHFVFNFTLINGVTTLFNMLGLSLVGIFTFLGFGLVVSSLGKDEQTVAPLANLIMMPQLFLSGAFFPIEAFPEFLQPVARILPMTFLNDAFRKVAFEGLTITSVLPQIASLIVWGLVIYLLVVKLFKWE